MKNVSKRNKMILAIVGILAVVVIAAVALVISQPPTNALFGAAVPTATPRTVTPGPSPTPPHLSTAAPTWTNTPTATRTNTPPPPTATRTSTPVPTSTPPVDTSFNPGAIGAYVRAIAVQPDGKILVGGNFNTLAGQPRHDLGRLNADGTLDTTFNPSPNSIVTALTLQPDGKIWVGGNFTQIAGRSSGALARLNPNGTLDMSYAIWSGVNAIAIKSNGEIWVAGKSGDSTQTILRYSNGAGIESLEITAGNSFNALLVQPDGKIVVGGDFSQVEFYYTQRKVSRNNILRVNADFSPDDTFGESAADGTVYPPSLNGPVYTLGYNSSGDGYITIGGAFSELTGLPGDSLTAHSLASVFLSGHLRRVAYDYISPGGIIYAHTQYLHDYLGGDFTTTSGDKNLVGYRISSTNGPVYAITALPNGSVLVGGAFTTVNGVARNNIALIRPQ